MASENPTELELLILKVLWKQSPLTAGEIRTALGKHGRKLAHTSVITMVQRMVGKGQLKQLVPVARKAYRFVPLISTADVSGKMLGDLVERVFDGSAEAVMLSLFDVADLDSESLKRLRRTFNQKMREQDNG